MNLRKRLMITIEEENQIIHELVETFRGMFNQNAAEKMEAKLDKLLSMDVGDDDTMHFSYSFEYNTGAIESILNRHRGMIPSPRPEAGLLVPKGWKLIPIPEKQKDRRKAESDRRKGGRRFLTYRRRNSINFQHVGPPAFDVGRRKGWARRLRAQERRQNSTDRRGTDHG